MITSFLKNILTLCIIIAASGEYCFGQAPYWGVRNIASLNDDSILHELCPGYQSWGIRWKSIETAKGVFNWTSVDNILESINNSQCPAIPVILIRTFDAWATPGSTQSNESAPFDIDRLTALTATIPDSGYSASLYAFTRTFLNYFSQHYTGKVYLRFVNEPWQSWKVNTNTKSQDMNDYVRCLRTFYKASHDECVQNGIEINVSHGGLPMEILTLNKWYQSGQTQTNLRNSLLNLFNAYVDRYSDGYFSSWTVVQQYMQSNSSLLDWENLLIENSPWVDYHDIHYHYKSWIIKSEYENYVAAMNQLALPIKPWFAGEAGMLLMSAGAKTFEESFHANDMAKKWLLGMAYGLKGICTPFIGAPPDIFYGLCSEDTSKYKAFKSYLFLKNLIPERTADLQIMEDSLIYHLRFPSYGLDIVWKNSLFDLDTSTVAFDISNYNNCTFFNALGDTLKPVTQVIRLNQNPVIIQSAANSINENKKKDSARIYPNPASQYAVIESSEKIDWLSLSTCLGKIVLQHDINNYNYSIDLSSLNQGLYYLTIKNEKHISTEKLLIVR